MRTLLFFVILLFLLGCQPQPEQSSSTNTQVGIPQGGNPVEPPKCAQCAGMAFDACMADPGCTSIKDLDGDSCCVNQTQ